MHPARRTRGKYQLERPVSLIVECSDVDGLLSYACSTWRMAVVAVGRGRLIGHCPGGRRLPDTMEHRRQAKQYVRRILFNEREWQAHTVSYPVRHKVEDLLSKG